MYIYIYICIAYCLKPVAYCLLCIASCLLILLGNSDAPAGTGPSQAQDTRMKMLWDKDFLYIAAVMDVAAGDQYFRITQVPPTQ